MYVSEYDLDPISYKLATLPPCELTNTNCYKFESVLKKSYYPENGVIGGLSNFTPRFNKTGAYDNYNLSLSGVRINSDLFVKYYISEPEYIQKIVLNNVILNDSSHLINNGFFVKDQMEIIIPYSFDTNIEIKNISSDFPYSLINTSIQFSDSENFNQKLKELSMQRDDYFLVIDYNIVGFKPDTHFLKFTNGCLSQ